MLGHFIENRGKMVCLEGRSLAGQSAKCLASCVHGPQTDYVEPRSRSSLQRTGVRCQPEKKVGKYACLLRHDAVWYSLTCMDADGSMLVPYNITDM